MRPLLALCILPTLCIPASAAGSGISDDLALDRLFWCATAVLSSGGMQEIDTVPGNKAMAAAATESIMAADMTDEERQATADDYIAHVTSALMGDADMAYTMQECETLRDGYR